MPATVTLAIVAGPLTGRRFVFDTHTVCIVGRAEDCHIRLPSDKAHQHISRHHCLLEINPPLVRVRDFGSRNGTFVNNRCIGCRPSGREAAAPSSDVQVDLVDGDRIRLSATEFEVAVEISRRCRQCGQVFSSRRTETPPVDRCPTCRTAIPPLSDPDPDGTPVCRVCGRRLSDDRTHIRGEVIVCRDCRQAPADSIDGQLARAGASSRVVFAGYRIEQRLGRGGMGAVYLARVPADGRSVALKVMRPRVAVSPRARRMFVRECRITKALDHPNIVSLLDFGTSDGTFYFTLEYCRGGSVKALMMRRSRCLGIDEAVDITLQALEGLEYAHQVRITTSDDQGREVVSRGVVHRDLKPANLFLTRSGDQRVVKVADFGLAKAFDNAGLSGLTATGKIGGTPRFMSFIQLADFKYARPDVDVWGMAACLYFMITGAYPRHFRPDRDPYLVILQDPPVPIRKRMRSLPPRLAEVIDTALIDRPRFGFESATAFRDALVAAVS